jgi:fructokinase
VPAVRTGIDVGGTKNEGIVLVAGREVARRRQATPVGDYEATVEAVVGLVSELERMAGGVGTVGVGIPGTVSTATGLVKNANSTWLNGRPFGADLSGRLAREVRLANDANCLAVSEAVDGAAAGADVVFGVIVGTGTGGGIAVSGRAWTGPNGVAGEWGHNPLPWPEAGEQPGPACYCGKHGCVEAFLSGPALAADHAAATGARLSPEAIVDAALAGESGAEATLGRYAGRMARALAAVINILDPDVIVLGGGLSNVAPLYDAVPGQWGRHVFGATGRDAATGPEPVRTRLARAVHGDSSGVRGAAWLWGIE